MTSEMAENWCPVTFWPKIHHGGMVPKKMNWPTVYYTVYSCIPRFNNTYILPKISYGFSLLWKLLLKSKSFTSQIADF